MAEFYAWMVFRWALAALACYRLAQLVGRDTLTAPIRTRLGRLAAGKGTWHPWTLLAEWAACPFCSGVWFAAGLALWLGPASFIEWAVLWLSIAGAQSYLERRAG